MRVLEPNEVAPWVREVLLDPRRDRPIVAVTSRPRAGTNWIDPLDLAAALGELADVVSLRTGDATWELSEALPPRLDAYGGAVRVWWPGLGEDSDPYDHRLYFIRSPGEARAVFEDLVEAVQQAAHRATPAPVVTARVLRVDGARVELEAGEQRGPLRAADVPLADLARCLAPGLELRARPIRVGDGWEFSVQGLLPSPWACVAEALHPEDVVIGRVQSVRTHGAIIEILPRVTGFVHVDHVDWEKPADIADAIRPGELVPVRIWEFEPDRRRLILSIKRGYLSPPRPLPSLAPGGLPFAWPDHAPAPQRAAAPPRDREDELAALTGELEAATADRRALREHNRDLKKQLRTAQDRLADLERRLEPELDPLSSERALLLGVRLAYARMFDEGTRHQHPLQKLRVGPAFLDSVRGLDGIETDKILEVCAQVAAGLAHEIEGRDVHQLRDGSRGAGSRTRAADSAQAWRCALQVKSPSARRLHWWSIPGPGGPTIELANVVLHDDFSIPE